MRLEPEDVERLDSWIAVIAQELRPGPVMPTAEGRRLGRKGSLAVATTALWHDHQAGKGGRGALSLIQHLRQCDAAGAGYWAAAWLDAHPGLGDFAADTAAASSENNGWRADFVAQVLTEATDPIGSPAEVFLRGRGLTPPFPPCARWLEDARLGEGAVLGVLTTETGEPVGVQLGYLTPTGQKSAALPARQLFLLDRERAEQGAFRITAPQPVEGAVELAITESLEKAIAIAESGAAATVLGVPGIGRFHKFDFEKGSNVVVVADGDEPTSPAAGALVTACDRWLLGGVAVRVTATPLGEDADSLLLKQGPDALRRLIAEAGEARLSFAADTKRLAGMDEAEAERARTEAAKRHGVRMSFLDKKIAAERAKAEAAKKEVPEDEQPWPEPVELRNVLDEALSQARRYVSADETALATVVAWCAHAHLINHERVHVPIAPRLAIQSPDKQCGKSTLMDVVAGLVPRPLLASSITAAAIFRVVEERQPTLLIDEADRTISDRNGDLLAVLNSSHRRSGATVLRVEEVGGRRAVVEFSTWCPAAFAGIRELPGTLQDRSVVVRLRRALPQEVQAHLRHGTSKELRVLRRKLIRWAADLRRLPLPKMPEGFRNRAADNWECLLAVAQLASGRWPGLIEAAGREALQADEKESTLVALLTGIRNAFCEKERLKTKEIIDALLADEEHDWQTASRGRPVNEAWLRERLRGVIAAGPDGKAGSEKWRAGKFTERGYTKSRFVEAWARYLPHTSSPKHPPQPEHPPQPLKSNGKSVADAGNPPATANPPATDTPPRSGGNGADVPDASATKRRIRHRKKATKSKGGAGVSDVAGKTGGKNTHTPKANGELGDEEII